jgi:hypothetical protein
LELDSSGAVELLLGPLVELSSVVEVTPVVGFGAELEAEVEAEVEGEVDVEVAGLLVDEGLPTAVELADAAEDDAEVSVGDSSIDGEGEVQPARRTPSKVRLRETRIGCRLSTGAPQKRSLHGIEAVRNRLSVLSNASRIRV